MSWLTELLIAEWQSLRRFLSPLTPEVRHRDVADLLTQGTGIWFLESDAFQEYLISDDKTKRILCCIGDPGVGKTGLAYVFHLPIERSVQNNLSIGVEHSKLCMGTNPKRTLLWHSYTATMSPESSRHRQI
jgi:hypothetical protein